MEQQLLDIFDKLQSANDNKLILAGSLGMKQHGINVRREPIDIDIWYPFKHTIVIPFDDYEELSESDYPEEEDTETSKYTKYMINSCKVDFFTTFKNKDSDIFSFQQEVNQSLINIKGRRVMPWQVSVKHKTEYAIFAFPTSKKHADDLVFFYSNNDQLFKGIPF